MTLRMNRDQNNIDHASLDTKNEIIERIEYVIQQTEAAANTTLDEVDQALLLLKETEQERLDNRIGDSQTKLAEIKTCLLNILAAQEYQDLCAQTLEFARSALSTQTEQHELTQAASRKNPTNTIQENVHDLEPAGPAFSDDPGSESRASQASIDAIIKQYK